MDKLQPSSQPQMIESEAKAQQQPRLFQRQVAHELTTEEMDQVGGGDGGPIAASGQ